jgi:hypothetical protein
MTRHATKMPSQAAAWATSSTSYRRADPEPAQSLEHASVVSQEVMPPCQSPDGSGPSSALPEHRMPGESNAEEPQ